MKISRTAWLGLTVLGLFLAVWLIPFTAIAEKTIEYFGGDDPDMPAFLADAKDAMTKEEYMSLRSEQISLYRGMKDGNPVDNVKIRNKAIFKLEKQENDLKASPSSPQQAAAVAQWMPIGPDPIPNGQTTGVSTPVSGRVTTIDVHPTNPSIVYVGTAMGGVYRSLDGGATWTPLLDGALSLAIGAVRVAPSQPDTVYVGTGEPNFCADCYNGVGVYRIDNASTATPTVSAVLGSAQFTGRGIGEILVHPTDPATIFVGSTSASAGINGRAGVPVTANRGLYRSTDATSASPTFAQIAFPFGNQNLSVRDIIFDPSNPDILLANVIADGGGILRTTNALAATPTFTQVLTFTGTSTSNLTGEFAAIHPAADANATFYLATGNNPTTSGAGRLLKSVDGGATFTAPGGGTGFCNGQCFYDIAVAVDPTNPNRVYLGGSPALIFGFSINGGATFTRSETGLHADSHAIAVAPSDPNVVYFGSDGGIYRSDTGGAALTQQNTRGFLATQFISLDTHPTDQNISLGGTQDNGTNRFTTAAQWMRADFGDGGYAVIDQSSPNNVTYNQYHTYFNASNLTGYAFSNNGAATESTWSFRGCNGGAAANGITCTGTINFYAPLERGPSVTGSNGNTIYYGADRLYRSINTGVNNTTESQIFTSAISAIGIAPLGDNVRVVGLNNGGLFGTTTSSPTLTDLDPNNNVPNNYVSRVVIDPSDPFKAYATLTVFNTPQIYKTANINTPSPTWTAISGAATGLPLVPVNAFITVGGNLYAGTDIGVYTSTDDGTTWTPYGTGLPRVAVFDLAFVPAGYALRAATHGKGIYQIALPMAPTAARVSVSGKVIAARRGIARAQVSITNAAGETRKTVTDSLGNYRFDNVTVGETYIFEAGTRKFTFAPQVLYVSEDVSGLNFTGNP